MMLAFGIAFEVLLLIMLNLAGILTHERFRKWRRVMIFALFVIVGMVNPNPDPITMLILGGLARPWSRRPSSLCGRTTAAGPGSTRTHMRACPTTSCPDRARRHGNPAAGLLSFLAREFSGSACRYREQCRLACVASWPAAVTTARSGKRSFFRTSGGSPSGREACRPWEDQARPILL
jgi:hypothetical protein